MISGKIVKIAGVCFLLAGIALVGCSDDSIRVLSPGETETSSIYTPQTGIIPMGNNLGESLDIQSDGNSQDETQGDIFVDLGQSLGDTNTGNANFNKDTIY